MPNKKNEEQMNKQQNEKKAGCKNVKNSAGNKKNCK